ncbi:MAG: LPS export ABC transporter periplasmic protein LptC [Candidatus Cloacimonetes bacterium]|nr:LPS export ABC transporter periplasmic protein LptC [Candidatus Cloacimonadota bacterium]
MRWQNLLRIWKVLLFSTFILWLCSCEDEGLPEMGTTNKSLPDEQSDSVKVITLDGEIISMEMHARHIDRYYKRKETHIDSLFLQNFNEDGSLKSTLTCNSAIINETRNEITCLGDVVVLSENGRLEAPKLVWDRDSNKVLAEEGVKLVRGDDVLWGERMRTDLELNNIEIVKVSATGTVKDGSVEW